MKKIKFLKGDKFVVKAQIHAGGRGKAGGVKLVSDIQSLKKEAKKMLGKTLITHQTGKDGKKLKDYILRRLQKYQKNFISLVLWIEHLDKIAFIGKAQRGMDI